jgi:hypothetical protein
VPNVYVRLTAMQEAKSSQGDQYDNLAINSLPGNAKFDGRIPSGVKAEELDQIIGEKISSWVEAKFKIQGSSSVADDGSFSITIDAGEPAHVAFGGPNPRQLLGEVLYEVEKRGKIISEVAAEGVRFGGTMRIRTLDHQQKKENVSEDLQSVLGEAIDNLSLNDKVQVDFQVQNSIVPVMNNPDMVRTARALFREAGIQLTKVNLPHAGAESFGEYERFFKPGEEKRMVYILIGGMKQEKAKQLLASKEPIDVSCIHHSDTFAVQDSAMPYGVSLDALAIQYAREWKKEKA